MRAHGPWEPRLLLYTRARARASRICARNELIDVTLFPCLLAKRLGGAGFLVGKEKKLVDGFFWVEGRGGVPI